MVTATTRSSDALIERPILESDRLRVLKMLCRINETYLRACAINSFPLPSGLSSWLRAIEVSSASSGKTTIQGVFVLLTLLSAPNILCSFEQRNN